MKFSLDGHRARVNDRRLRPTIGDEGRATMVVARERDRGKGGDYIDAGDTFWLMEVLRKELVFTILETARQRDSDPKRTVAHRDLLVVEAVLAEAGVEA